MTDPKMLYIDIETSPLITYSWGIWKADALDVIEESRMLGYAYAFGQNKTRWVDMWHTDYGQALQDLWSKLDAADWVVAHNGDRFDIKRMNLDMARAGMQPPSPYRTIDTLKIARQAFGNHSNSLKYLARTFHLEEKFSNSGFKLWTGYMADEVWARREMSTYARQDVDTLRELYQHIKAWGKTHPNMGLYRDGLVCRVCGSSDVQKRGFHETNAGLYQRYQCKDCGSYSRESSRQQAPVLR